MDWDDVIEFGLIMLMVALVGFVVSAMVYESVYPRQCIEQHTVTHPGQGPHKNVNGQWEPYRPETWTEDICDEWVRK